MNLSKSQTLLSQELAWGWREYNPCFFAINCVEKNLILRQGDMERRTLSRPDQFCGWPLMNLDLEGIFSRSGTLKSVAWARCSNAPIRRLLPRTDTCQPMNVSMPSHSLFPPYGWIHDTASYEYCILINLPCGLFHKVVGYGTRIVIDSNFNIHIWKSLQIFSPTVIIYFKCYILSNLRFVGHEE